MEGMEDNYFFFKVGVGMPESKGARCLNGKRTW